MVAHNLDPILYTLEIHLCIKFLLSKPTKYDFSKSYSLPLAKFPLICLG